MAKAKSWTIDELLDELRKIAVLPAEAAEIMELEVDAVRNYCRTGRLADVVKFGNEWLIPRTSIDSYMATSRNRQGRKKKAEHGGSETGT